MYDYRASFYHLWQSDSQILHLVGKCVDQRREPILHLSRDGCCFLSRCINLLPYIFTRSGPLVIPQRSPGCDKIFLRTEPMIPLGFNVSGQPWAQLNFYKNLLGKDRNSSLGNCPIRILSAKTKP